MVNANCLIHRLRTMLQYMKGTMRASMEIERWCAAGVWVLQILAGVVRAS